MKKNLLHESAKKVLTQKRLKELLKYNHRTGNFIWRVNRNNHRNFGKVAGCIKKHGYRGISVDGNYYYAHRLVWLYHYGYFPENQIDHINRNRKDNRIENLRDASQQCNSRNSKIRITNNSGVAGVCWDKQTNKWRVYININGKQINLGLYTDFTEAVCHRLAAEQAEDWNGCNSSSSAFQYVQRMLHS